MRSTGVEAVARVAEDAAKWPGRGALCLPQVSLATNKVSSHSSGCVEGPEDLSCKDNSSQWELEGARAGPGFILYC